MTLRLLAGLLVIAATPLGAQGDVAARLAGRVSPEVAALVRQLAVDAAARGLPVDPLVQKAIEGGAKGVPADRVASAVRGVAGQLDAAAGALREGGMTPPDTEAIAAGAFALNAGLRGQDVADLARRSGDTYGVAATLRVAGTLAALGVPAAEIVALISETIRAGRRPADLLALPGRVQAEMARGATPAQAAAGLARAAAARGNPNPPHPSPDPPGQSRPKNPHHP
ncbi:MAG TPA: hypothetical protein VGQ25_01085 [Gemmatimonadales bacterium]|nr:hypothetical protein [Gemmatimonadales bacterium]